MCNIWIIFWFVQVVLELSFGMQRIALGLIEDVSN